MTMSEKGSMDIDGSMKRNHNNLQLAFDEIMQQWSILVKLGLLQ